MNAYPFSLSFDMGRPAEVGYTNRCISIVIKLFSIGQTYLHYVNKEALAHPLAWHFTLRIILMDVCYFSSKPPRQQL